MTQGSFGLPIGTGASSRAMLVHTNSLKQRPVGNRRNQRGQALVEFALVFPILVFLLMGMFDLGRGVYAYNVVASAAREGARYAIMKPTDVSGMKAQARAVTPALDPAQLIVDNPVCSSAYCKKGDAIVVTVRYAFQPITAFFTTVNLVGKSTMTIE